MLLLKIILGLIGLGVVVFIHELGHFIAARLAKIDVEAFSIGWGNPILKKKIGEVEYRLGAFPLGGYCKMKGETDYNEAWENMKNGTKPQAGSYLAASPAGRILVAFGGPFFNLVFAVLLFTLLHGFGFERRGTDSRIVLASEVSGELSPADEAGLMTGDRVLSINNRDITYFSELRESIVLNPKKTLPVTVERDGRIIHLEVTPYLDKTGAGMLGIYPWVDTEIEEIKEGSPAERAGLKAGDRITAINGERVINSVDIIKIMNQKPQTLVLEYDSYYNNSDITGQAEFNMTDFENSGIIWKTVSYRTPNLSVPAAVATGVKESWKTLAVSIKSLRLLFMGIDLTQAVSGPVRITYMMGDIATESFSESAASGFRSLASFVAIISVALCVMNLLPLPILDGGMIILFLIELVRRKPAHPRAISIFQTCGMVIIFTLMVFALFGDILYFVRR